VLGQYYEQIENLLMVLQDNLCRPRCIQVGHQYGLSVMFSLRFLGKNLNDLPGQTGIDALPRDIMQFLVSLDTAAALNVSTSDVGVCHLVPLQCPCACSAWEHTPMVCF
jgi:hypothetical protein